jgi:hypothetical protein
MALGAVANKNMAMSIVRKTVLAAVLLSAVPARSQTVAPVPETGVADAGIASRPIANVAANDTVNGAPATLGASGNATVSQSGIWPTGIALTPATGAVSTKVTVAPDTYSITYQLCDKAAPPNCAIATDTVNVVTPMWWWA